MQKNEKAAAGARNTGSSRGNQASQQDIPQNEYNMARTVVQVVEPFLRQGAEHAISTRELQRWTGLGIRDLRAQVAREREAGALILSRAEGGYFLPDEGEKGQQEMRRFLVTMRGKAVNTLRATIPAQEALRQREERHEEASTTDGD